MKNHDLLSKTIVLFVSGDVGYQIAKYTISKINVPIIIIDSNDPGKERIRNLSNSTLFIESSRLDESYDILRNIKCDLFILGWWPYILSNKFIAIPNTFCINCHPSYLPYSRGKHYYFWNFVDKSPSGVSIHIVDEKIDHGPICFQEEIPTSWEDNGESIVRKSRRCLIRLYKKHFMQILSLSFPTTENKTNQGTFHLASEIKQKSCIDLNKEYKARDLLNIIRGCSGFPGKWAYFNDNNDTYEVSIQIRKKK